jgi:serine/threonine protein kinase
MERQFGPYRLVRQVAVGGMAEIHLAKARGIAGFEKYVALKMIHPNFAEDEQFIEMLVDEAKIAVQLTHHNIAQTFDLGRVGDTYYISMEYVDGADLYKVLRRASEQDIEFPLDVCAFVAKEVASGLDYAHRKRDVAGQPLGIVHRDVSPQNVLVSYAGEVKLVDFGIAKATMKVKQTAAGVIKGKYYYMSPEQASGGNVDSRSDIFSAGIVLYEMLTGQMLYLEEDLHRLLDMVRRADIAPPSKLRRGIPPQLERIVMHALAKTPQDRYQSGTDMASDLERFLHAHSPVFTPAKVVSLLRQAVGDGTLNMENHESSDVIIPLDDSELMRAPGEMRDSNSVIFRVKPRPLSEGFPHIDTNGATDSGQNGVLAIEVEEMAGGGSRSADGKRVEPAKEAGRGETKRGAAAPVPIPPATKRPAAQPVAPPQPANRPPAGPGALPRVRQSTAPLPSSDGVPRRSPSQPTRPVPSKSSPPGAGSGPAKLPQVAPVTGTKSRGVYDDTRELPNDFDEESAPQTGVIDPPSGGAKGPGRASTTDISFDEVTAENGAMGASGAAKQAAGSPGNPGNGRRPTTARPATAAPSAVAPPVMPTFGLEDMEGGDSTMVSQIPNFYTETGEVETTMVNASMPVPEHTDYGETQIRSQPQPPRNPRQPTRATASAADDDDGPTQPGGRALTSTSGSRQMPVGKPAALAAKNPTPAVSELRRPRPSRSTPQSGVNVLQAIVAAPGNEPMPAAPRRAATPPPIPAAQPAVAPSATPQPMPVVTPQAFEPTMTAPHTYLPAVSPQQGMGAQGFHAPPPPYGGNGEHSGAMQAMAPMQGMSSAPMQAAGSSGQMLQHGSGEMQQMPHAFSHLSGQFAQQPNMYPQGQSPYAAAGYPLPQSGAFPSGVPAPTATGRLRALEVDEIPAHYRIKREGPRWFVLLGIALTAVATAASVTFLVLRANRQQAIASAALRLESLPSGAVVYIDDMRLAETTPVTFNRVKPSGRYTVRLELPKHKPYSQEVIIGSTGGEVIVNPMLQPLTGRVNVNTVPDGADVFINSLPRGRTPLVISDLDMDSTKAIEVRRTGSEPYRQDLVWPPNGTIDIKITLTPTRPR